MLSVMRDETADVRRRDDMAKAVAAYIHPRLQSMRSPISLTAALIT
jgi:hypothetical protein